MFWGQAMEDTICDLIRRIRPGRSLDWIRPNRADHRRRITRDILEALREAYPGRVPHPVREAAAVADAFTAGLPVSLYHPTSPVARDYARALHQITGHPVTPHPAKQQYGDPMPSQPASSPATLASRTNAYTPALSNDRDQIPSRGSHGAAGAPRADHPSGDVPPHGLQHPEADPG